MTRVALVLVVAALRAVGSAVGDRIEHAAVVPPELRPALRKLGITVVTQPSLPVLRGDEYLAEVDEADVAHLWPYRSLLDAGVPVACSSDAPYGSLDPWASITAAVRRRTASGRAIGRSERVSAETALNGYLTRPLAPGGPPRVVVCGAPADLVCLQVPLAQMLFEPSAEHVVATVVGGVTVYRR